MAGIDPNPYDTIQDIEAALGDYIDAHPEWQTHPSGAVVEEISGLIQGLWDAASVGTPLKRRRPAPKPRDGFGPDDIPF